MKTRPQNAGKLPSFISLIIPGTTVLISSSCIMALELVAGRLTARYLGSSLYTWTAVIAVVLAGITLGNYLGGRIADRFRPKRALAILLTTCSVACVVTVMLSNLVGKWSWLWQLSWPAHTLAHVLVVFLLPSILLGTISPVAAKMALDKGLSRGRTVGDIYACGAAGSIIGTFATGYYLIATMGNIVIIWMVAAVLLLMALYYGARLRLLYVWLALFLCAATMGTAPWGWAGSAGVFLALREEDDPKILYKDDSQYNYIAVRRLSKVPDKRVFMQDKLKHSEMIMGQVTDLQYEYSQIYAAVTHRLSSGKDKLSVLAIGGGGYVFPRYIETLWPGSHIDVVEIDPAVTKAATEAFGFEPSDSIRTFNMDARNYVDELIETQRRGGLKRRYDFIYEDAINDYSVPFQLTTKQFNDKIAAILSDDGIYLVNLIDIYDSGLFLGSCINTLEQTFPYVYVITIAGGSRSTRRTFVVVAAKQKIELDNLAADYKQKYLDLWQLNKFQMAELKTKAGGLILTDDYAPTENLLAPVVRLSSANFLAEKYIALAKKLAREDKFSKIIDRCETALRNNPAAAAEAYAKIGVILALSDKKALAIEILGKALKAAEKAEVEIAAVHSNLGLILREVGQTRAANRHLARAAEVLRRESELYPGSAKVRFRLGDVLASGGDFKAASEAFAEALVLNPTDPAARMKLVQSLELQGHIEEAIVVLRRGLQLPAHQDQVDTTTKFEKYIERLMHKTESR